jgi:group I intron endonuclease
VISRKANTYRLYPTPQQAQLMAQTAGACRSGIYCIRHDVDGGRIYVGSAKSFTARWKAHRKALRRGDHHSRHLQRAWAKHGTDAFVFSILDYVPDISDLLAREQHWIDLFQACDPIAGFNLCPIAGSALGVKHTAQTRAKISARRLGAVHSTETRAAISAALMGRSPTQETREKLRAANAGKRLAPERIAAMSAARKGVPILTERHPGAKANLSAAQKNSLRSIEHQKALTLAHIGAKRTDETKAAISAGITKWWADKRAAKEAAKEMEQRPDDAGSIRRAA